MEKRERGGVWASVCKTCSTMWCRDVESKKQGQVRSRVVGMGMLLSFTAGMWVDAEQGCRGEWGGAGGRGDKVGPGSGLWATRPTLCPHCTCQPLDHAPRLLLPTSASTAPASPSRSGAASPPDLETMKSEQEKHAVKRGKANSVPYISQPFNRESPGASAQMMYHALRCSLPCQPRATAGPQLLLWILATD